MKVKLENISKVIKQNVILRDINLELESGKIYGFIGTNGSGKTMLMRILTGLVSATNGKIIVDEKEVNRNKELYFDMGVIIEKPEFFNEMTGLENLEILAKIKNKIDKEKIIESMNSVELDPNNIKKVKEYSLGMRQRLGIAQAIMEDFDVLVLDEVTSALDEAGVKMVYRLLSKEREKGKLIVISSHNKDDIDELCDTIYTFKNQTII